MRYFVELSYNGGRYCGWQRQRDAASVQETLERALSTLLREPVEVTGAGRTDTGVHAAYAVAHFDVAAPLTDPEHTAYKLNCLLPDDVAVFGVAPVADDAHAVSVRRSASTAISSSRARTPLPAGPRGTITGRWMWSGWIALRHRFWSTTILPPLPN